MTFIDTYTDSLLTIQDIKREWEQFSTEDPDNHADRFTVELFEILMATVNGRNDMDVMGMTGPEVSRYILRLREKV